MGVRNRIDQLVTEWVILVVGWVVFLVYGYPGYMSYDSAYELAQARHIELMNDWHPPVFSILWRFTDSIIAGPFPMLVIQSTLFILGVRALLRYVLSPRAAAVATIALLLAPPTVVVFGVIWKDALMAACLVSGVACLFTQRRSWRLAGYVFIFFATALRYNSAAATLPIVILQFGWGVAMPRWRRVALASALWVAIALGAVLLNGHFVQERKYPWQTSVALADIAGVIKYAPNLTDEEVHRETPGVPWHITDHLQARVRTGYRPTNHFLILTSEPGQIFEYPTTDEHRAALTAAWKQLVSTYPRAYIHHRLSVFRAQMGNDSGLVWDGFTDPVYIDLLGHRALHSPLQQKWVNAMFWLEETVVFRSSFYFLIALALLPLCRRNRLALVLLASGIVYELGFLVAAPAVGFRYSQWLAETTMLAALILFVSRLRGRALGPDA